MNNEGKEGSFAPFFIVMFISLGIALLWNTYPTIKETAHLLLDPSLGVLLSWNITIGFIILIFILSLVTSLSQKYLSDQETLRELKKEQKELQKEINNYKHDPEKMMEIQKNLIPSSMKMFKLSMRPAIYTSVPLILLFRWFMDTFETLGNPKFFGIFSWFWFYLIVFMIFSSILRKVLKIA